jgi:hypothetical protein
MSFNKSLQKIKTVFEKENICWAVFAGLGAKIYGSERKITDIDIIVQKNNIKKTNKCIQELGGGKLSFYDDGMFSCLNSQFKINGIDIDISSDIKMIIKNKKFFFKLDNLTNKKIIKSKNDIPVLSPEDIIIFKAITQRGQDQGKFDIFDIKNILKKQEIDFDYLRKRAKKCKAEKRVTKLINSIKNQ